MKWVIVIAFVLGLMVPSVAMADTQVESGIRSISVDGKPTSDWEVEKGKDPDASDKAASKKDENASPSAGRVPVNRSMLAISCQETYAQVTRTSSLGFLLWRFKHFARWCSDGTKITTQPPTRTASAFVDDSSWTYEGLSQSQGWKYQYCCSHPYSGHYGLRQGHFTNWTVFPKTIKLADAYPTVEIWVHADRTRCWRTSVSSGIKC